MAQDITQIITGLDRQAEGYVNDIAKGVNDKLKQKLKEFGDLIRGDKKGVSDKTEKDHTLLTHGRQVVAASVEKLKQTKEAKDLLIPWTDLQCQAAIAMIKDIVYTVQQMIQLPNKLLATAARIVNNVTDSAISMVNQATSFLDKVGSAIDGILSGGNTLAAIQELLDAATRCPLLASSDIGKSIQELRNKLQGSLGQNVQKEVNALKQKLVGPVNEAIREVAKTPLGKLAEMSKMYNDALKRGGVIDAMNKLNQAVNCLNMLCKSINVINTVYSSDFDKTISKMWDKTTGTIKEFGVGIISDQVNAGIKGIQGLQMAVNSGIGGAGRAVSDITRGIDAARTHAGQAF